MLSFFPMRTILTFLLLVLSFETFSKEAFRRFETDYCTNFPEGTLDEPDLWKHCCLMHDMFFWAGGSKADRDSADLGLKSCIEATGEREIAELMYWGVRVGSYSPVKYPDKKWNNAWPDRQEFQNLSWKDIDLIEKEIFSGYSFIPKETKSSFLHDLRSRLE